MPSHVSDEIKHFFKVYKSLEGKKTIVENELEGPDIAQSVILDSINRYKEKFNKE